MKIELLFLIARWHMSNDKLVKKLLLKIKMSIDEDEIVIVLIVARHNIHYKMYE